jgi:hypothetical protein
MAVYYKQRRTSEIFKTSTVLQIAVKSGYLHRYYRYMSESWEIAVEDPGCPDPGLRRLINPLESTLN